FRTRLAQLLETIAADALAHVEREHHVQRNLLEADEIDLLRHAVIEHFEVARLETSERGTSVAIGHQYIHTYRLDLRREHGGLSLDVCHDHDDRKNGTDAHLPSVCLNGF